MNFAAAKSFAQRGAALRRGLWGRTEEGEIQEFDYDRGAYTFRGYLVANTTDHRLDGLNLVEERKATLRALKPLEFTPAKGKRIKVLETTLVYVIDEISPDHPAAVEWVFSLTQP